MCVVRSRELNYVNYYVMVFCDLRFELKFVIRVMILVRDNLCRYTRRQIVVFVSFEKVQCSLVAFYLWWVGRTRLFAAPCGLRIAFLAFV